MFVDYVMNGSGFGEVGQRLAAVNFDPGYMRPFVADDGKMCVSIRTGRTETRKNAEGNVICNAAGVPKQYHVLETVRVSDLLRNGQPAPVVNATTLRKNEWQELDAAVLRQARTRLRAWNDLNAANPFTVNGMGKTILEHETMSDPGEAVMDMDGLTDARDDDALFQLESIPLPITHSDFSFSERRLMASRNTGEGLDTIRAETAGRRVAELVEKHVIGEVGAYGPVGAVTQYGTSPQIYGYTTHPDINSGVTLTTPTGAATSDSTLANVLAMRQELSDANMFGPYMLYHSADWDQYMDNDYVTGDDTAGLAAPNVTLRNRLKQIDGILDVRRLDVWTATTELLLVQMTADVAQAVTGMPITTVQWDSRGGLQKHFKVMTIMVPRIRSDFNSQCGISHGTL